MSHSVRPSVFAYCLLCVWTREALIQGVDTRERERERERERGAKKGLKRKESRERRESMKHNVDRGKGNNRKEQHLWRRVHNFVSYFRSGGTNDAHLY